MSIRCVQLSYRKRLVCAPIERENYGMEKSLCIEKVTIVVVGILMHRVFILP